MKKNYLKDVFKYLSLILISYTCVYDKLGTKKGFSDTADDHLTYFKQLNNSEEAFR